MKHNRFNKWFGRHPHFTRRKHYEPWYDEHSDFNTNAKSYYDYLARFNRLIRTIVEFVNRLLDRNIKFENTNSIDFTKQGDWIDNGECEPDNYDDVINVSAVVNISDSTETRNLNHTTPKTFTVPNGSLIKNNGLWSPDYFGLLNALDDEIGIIQEDIVFIYEQLNNINQEIQNIKNDITAIKAENVILRRGLQQIVDNLYASGAISSNNLNNFVFNSGRNIATGNINLFGGTPDGNSHIRTNNGSTNNDITAGI